MYADVHARPDGDSTVARMALTAADQGYDGVVVRNHGDRQAEYDADAVADRYDVDVVEGIEIRTDDRGQAANLVGNYRDRREFVLVHGGDVGINRFACERPEVDVLAHPMADGGDVNHVFAKAAARNGVRLAFDFGPVLRLDGGPRVQAIQGLRKLRELVEAYDVPYVVSVNPSAHLHLRAPRELFALGETIGFSRDQVEAGLAEWGEVATRNRERLSEEFLEPGVRIEDHEEDD